MSQNAENQQITVKSKKKLWVVGGILAVMLCLSIFNFDVISETYRYIFSAQHFEKGDKVYASGSFFDPNEKGSAIAVYRLIRPLTAKEINNDTSLILDDAKKNRLIKSLNPGDKPYLTDAAIVYAKGKMLENHTAIMGTYLDKAFMRLIIKEQNFEGTRLFYFIKPDKSSVKIEPISNHLLPENYTFADSIYYVTPLIADKQEAAVFH